MSESHGKFDDIKKESIKHERVRKKIERKIIYATKNEKFHLHYIMV